jgi:aerobic-type carbon monoxide dehydrogenase small subunit (CoxS/CutS family)
MTNNPTVFVNGAQHEIPAAWMGRRLIDFLRTELNLVGAKEGCGEGDCGACTVLVDGEPMCSCLLLCGVVASKQVTTLEGLAEAHIARFGQTCEAEGGVQCGFCTGGIAMMSAWIKDGGTETGNEAVSKLLEGNICRCGGYQQLEETLNKFR